MGNLLDPPTEWMNCVTRGKTQQDRSFLTCNVGEGGYNMADRRVRHPVAAHHNHIVITVPQPPILSKISGDLRRKGR